MAANKARVAYMIYSSIIMVLGLAIVVIGDFSVDTLSNIVGGIILACGIIKAILYFADDNYGLAFQFDMAQGIFFVLVGALLIIKPVEKEEYINLIVGIFVIADGTCKLQTSRETKKFGMKCWVAILTLAIITTISGALLATNPLKEKWLLIVGLALALDGIENLIIAIYTISLERRKNKGEKAE